MRPDIYTPSFRRALFKYVNNGFFARGLDADDHAFLEQVRVKGLANGEVASPYDSGLVFAEEMEFWTHPFSVDPHPVDLREIHIRKEENIEKRKQIWEQRKRDKALKTEELRKANQAWEKERLKRERQRLQRIVDDIEWDRSDPKKIKARNKQRQGEGKRFYKPIWLDEQEAEKPAPKVQKKLDGAARSDSEEANQYLAKQAEERALHQLKIEQAMNNLLGTAEELSNTTKTTEQKLSDKWHEYAHLSWNMRMQRVKEFKKTDELTRTQKWQLHEQRLHAQQRISEKLNQEMRDDYKDALKITIVNLLLKFFPLPMKFDELMARTGCKDADLMCECVKEIVAAGGFQLEAA